MHIKHLNRGTGKASNAARYLLKGTEAEQIKVLRGDPDMVAQVADSLLYRHKYTSGVIAWHPDDKPTQAEIDAVLNDYEQLAFAGLSPSQYSFSAVQHIETDGSTHVHTFAARCELSTGKSFNPVPPGSLQAFDTIRDYHNEKQGWKNPADPMLARGTKLGNTNLPRVKREAKQHIDEALTSQVKSGFVKNRDDVIEQLTQAGFEIARETARSISIKDPQGGQNLRLTGLLYERDFNSVTANDRASETANRASKAVGENGIESIRERYQSFCRQREEYNHGRYSKTRKSVRDKEIGTDNAVRPQLGSLHISDDVNRRFDLRISERQDTRSIRERGERPTLDAMQRDIHRSENQTKILPHPIIESNYDRVRRTIKQCLTTSASRLSTAVQRLESTVRAAKQRIESTSRQHRNKHAQHEQEHRYAHTDSRRAEKTRQRGLSM